jgi:hypothetical protein
MTAKHQSSGSPDVDEVGGNPAAVIGDQPHPREVRTGEEHRLGKDDGETDRLDKPRRLRHGASSRGYLEQGHWPPASLFVLAKLGRRR